MLFLRDDSVTSEAPKNMLSKYFFWPDWTILFPGVIFLRSRILNMRLRELSSNFFVLFHILYWICLFFTFWGEREESKIRLFTTSILSTHAKEKANETSEKHLPCHVSRFALASTFLAMLSARWMIDKEIDGCEHQCKISCNTFSSLVEGLIKIVWVHEKDTIRVNKNVGATAFWRRNNAVSSHWLGSKETYPWA